MTRWPKAVTRQRLTREPFLAGSLPEVLVGSARADGHLPGVILEPIRLRQHEAFHLPPSRDGYWPGTSTTVSENVSGPAYQADFHVFWPVCRARLAGRIHAALRVL